MGESPRSWAGTSAVNRSVHCLWQNCALGNNHNVSSTRSCSGINWKETGYVKSLVQVTSLGQLAQINL